METRLNFGGLVIAVIGFVLTRFTVTLAIYEDPLRFFLAGVVPLLLGLGLAAFGVALVVADVNQQLVRSTALWCVIGTSTMAALVVLTLLGSNAGGMPALPTIRSQTYLSNFLIGGALGGSLTGLYAARIRRQQSTLEAQANRLEVLHRILRHDVLNAVTVIRGYASMDNTDAPNATDIIQRRADGIERTIEEVRYLTWSATSGRVVLGGNRAQSHN